ncbi:MAG: ABC transporter ATP-binding protein/permease [Prevotella sp.]|nr:ABC transporter ATP-binding protein/permease [Prevotella sp.]
MFAKLRSILEIPDNKYTVRQISCWLWKALQGNRLQAVLNAGIGLLGVGLGLVSVWAMQRAIDTASGVRDGSILWAVGIMALLILGEFALGISRVWIRNILGVKAQNRMQQHILARLLRSEWRGREAMHSGDVINRLEDDVKTVVTFLTETLPSTLSTMAMFVGAFIYLFRMDIWLAVITVGILPLFISVSRIYMVYMRRYSRKVRDCDSLVQALLTETMQHRMLVKTMEADQQMLERLDTIQTTLHSWVRKRTIFSVGSNFFLNVGFSLGYLVAFLWGAFRLSAGTLTFGGMTAFLQLVSRIQGPARDFSRLLPAFVSVFTAAERLMELAEIPEEEQGDALVLSAPCGICFERVTFSYGNPGQQPVLQDATFDFPPGTCTAILGETGSGKTTLIRLLLALVRPQQGRIVIYSGLDKKVGEEQLLSPLHRCNFVYVPQGNTLLSGTLRENLLLGNPHATDEQMHEALRLACADFVDALPDGLDATFTEQGGGLSEGQAQRIAIARALLRPGSIMLLDEATSALDTETERKVLENILREKQRTVIFVTHRTAVVDYCDHTITFS